MAFSRWAALAALVAAATPDAHDQPLQSTLREMSP